MINLVYANLLLESKGYRIRTFSCLNVGRNAEHGQLLVYVYPFFTLLFEGPENRKERNETEFLRMEMRFSQKVEEGRSSTKEKH
jgi:hypothetical protein